MQTLSWTKRAYLHPAQIKPAVDYYQVAQDTQLAIADDFAFAYYTEALCRYESVGTLTSAIACDCLTDAQSCFSLDGPQPIGKFRVCPYQKAVVRTLDASVTVQADGVPTSLGCQIITISETSVGRYQVPPDYSVTTPLFLEVKSNKNPYFIVQNAQKAVIGILASDAITLNVPFVPVSPLTLCIELEPFIVVSEPFTLLTLASLQDNKTITVYESSLSFPVPDPSLNGSNRTQVCGLFNSSGTWFAVAVSPNYAQVNPTQSGESLAALGIYAAVGALSIIQAVLVFLDRRKQRLLVFKFTALFIIMLNAAARCVYIAFPRPTHAMNQVKSDALQFVLYELPTFLFFSVFTVIVYLWLLVITSTYNFDQVPSQQRQPTKLRRAIFAVNLFMYFVFIVFIYLIAILPSYSSSSPCYLGSLDSTISTVERGIRVAYWTLQTVISVVLGVSFTIAAAGLLKLVYSLHRQSQRPDSGLRRTERARALDVQMVAISVVAFVCILFLFIRCALFLSVAVHNSSIHVIAFCLLEVVPQTMLVFYLHPLHCFREAGRSTSTSRRSRQRHAAHSSLTFEEQSGLLHDDDDGDQTEMDEMESESVDLNADSHSSSHESDAEES